MTGAGSATFSSSTFSSSLSSCAARGDGDRGAAFCSGRFGLLEGGSKARGGRPALASASISRYISGTAWLAGGPLLGLEEPAIARLAAGLRGGALRLLPAIAPLVFGCDAGDLYAPLKMGCFDEASLLQTAIPP